MTEQDPGSLFRIRDPGLSVQKKQELGLLYFRESGVRVHRLESIICSLTI